MAQTLLNKNLDWAQRWRDRGPVAQRLYPNQPSAGSGGTTTGNAGSGSGGTTTTAQRPPSLAAAMYPHLKEKP